MRLANLLLRNIEPFIEVDMDFFNHTAKSLPVVMITGENGTGKSIILDAIRGMFDEQFCILERDIRRKQSDGQANIKIILELDQNSYNLESNVIYEDRILTDNWSGNRNHS